MDMRCTINRYVPVPNWWDEVDPRFVSTIRKISDQEEDVYWVDLDDDTREYASNYFSNDPELRVCNKCTLITSDWDTYSEGYLCFKCSDEVDDD